MKRNPRAVSLANRLSGWLILLSLVVLVLASGTVYVAVRMHLDDRQAELLQHKTAFVTLALKEAQRDNDIPGLQRTLDGFLSAFADEVAVSIIDAQGATIYQVDPRTAPKRARTVQFTIPAAAGTAGPTTVHLSQGTGADDTLLRRLAIALVAASLLGSVVVAVGGLIVVRVGLRPVRGLARQTENVTASTLSHRLDGTCQPRELQPLVLQSNGLLDRLERAYEQLEGFNADVAHELNTPLATLIASTELALRGERDPEQRERLGCNLEELRRMSGIVRDMLFLSQAERGARARRTSAASLAAVAAEVADYHEAALSDAKLQVDIVGDVSGDFDVPLFKRALSNLLGNASRYADPGSTIRVELGETRPGMVRVVVVNRGEPIRAEHLPRLFDRFYRADTSRSDSHSHTGLGLSIVAAIARMHGGRPLAQSGERTTTVGVLLPSR